MMDPVWFEMTDIRRRKLNTAVWIPLRAAQKESTGEFGTLGYREEYFGAVSIAVPLDKKAKAESLGWGDLGMIYAHRGSVEGGRYIPADVFDGYGLNLNAVALVLVQEGNAEDPTEWLLHQDLAITLDLKREGDAWLATEEGYIEVARLKRNPEGHPILLEVRAEQLKDYLCGRGMALYISSYRNREEVGEGNVGSIQSSNTNGISAAYTYDNLNRLSTVVDNRLSAGQNTTTYTYDPASNLATVTYPNGLQSTFTYDDLNRLTNVNGYQYTLGPTGNRTVATEPGGRTLNWSYDGIYRLTQETISLDPHSKNGTVGYGLDPVGNRLSQNSSLPGIGSGTFSYDQNDRLSTETYDADGNTLTSGGKTFTYDFENRIKAVNGGAITIQYDGDGNRVAKTVNGVTTRYLMDDLNPTGYAQVVEELVNGAVQRTYTYGVLRISQNQFINSAWVPSFYGYDGDGSVRMLIDASGTVTDTYEFDAWGNTIDITGSTTNHLPAQTARWLGKFPEAAV